MNRSPYIILLLFALTASCLLHAQNPKDVLNLHPPLTSYQALSGTFGEIRPGSIHAGLDFRTGGKVGLPVFASQAGYVSRIKISSVGYGKAVYITHPTGITTVYAHLDRLSEKIEKVTKDEQYKKKSYDVDIHLGPKSLPVERGETIGLSGNTGSSGGPHLHFEVRNTKTQEPQNPSFSTLKITDKIAPVVRSAWIYHLSSAPPVGRIQSRQELNIKEKNGSYAVSDTILIEGGVGIGIETYDYVNEQSLRCGVYSIKMYVNNSLHYHFAVDKFAFNESRYTNSHMDYALNYNNGKRVHKLFIEPNNKFSIYKTVQNRGIIQAKTDKVYNIRVEIADSHNNTTQFTLVAKGVDKGVYAPKKNNLASTEGILWPFFQSNQFSNKAFSINMPAKALYSSTYFNYHISSTRQAGAYSPTITVGDVLVPLHRNYSLAIATDPLDEHLREKALIAFLDKEGKIFAVGGDYKDGFVHTKVNFFGDFFVTTDTIPPKIQLIKPPTNDDFSDLDNISFKITDDLAGIESIEGYIDDEWVLFEYDKKNDLAFYKFDSQRLTNNSEHQLRIEVSDSKGNATKHYYTFRW